MLKTHARQKLYLKLNLRQKYFKGKNLANNGENFLKNKYLNSPKIHTNLTSVILFTRDQFVDMKSSTADLNSFLSIDRTFILRNLFSNCYLI